MEDSINTSIEEHYTVISGFIAEVIAVQADKSGLTPEQLVSSFFGNRCNALELSRERGSNLRTAASF